MSLLFTIPRQVVIADGARPYPGALAYFFQTGTSTPANVYTTSARNVAHDIPVEADATGVFPAIYLDPSDDLDVTLRQSDGTLIYTQAHIVESLSAADIGEALYARTAAEISAGVTPTNYQYPAGTVNRYGTNAVPGSTDMSSAAQAAIDVGGPVYFLDETYAVNNLTSNTNSQEFGFYGDGLLTKNANGPILTVNGDRTLFYNARLYGNSASFTGHNLVKNGDHMTLAFCSSIDAAGRAVYDSSGYGLRITGTNDAYYTSDLTSDGWCIEVSGVGQYSRITDIQTTIPTGGILVSGAGVTLQGCQVGKVKFTTGGGGSLVNCRVNGAMNVEASNCVFSNNTYSDNVTLGDGNTAFSGIVFANSNVMENGTIFLADTLQDCVIHVEQLQDLGVTVTLTDAGVDNYIVSRRIAYTPAFTGSVSDPVLGDGSIQDAWYVHCGRRIRVGVALLMGSTTTYGSGAYRIGLPFAVSGSEIAIGAALCIDATNVPVPSTARTAGGTSYAMVYTPIGNASSAVPFTWAENDRLEINIEYGAG